MATGAKLTVTHNTSTWTNRLEIEVGIKEYNPGDIILNVSDELGDSVNIDMTNINDVEYDTLEALGINKKPEKLIFSLKKSSEEIAREEIDISNYDNIAPVISDIDITSIDSTTYQNMNTLKIDSITDDGGSGLKELRYELITEDNTEELTTKTEEYLKSKGKYVDISNIGDDGVILKIPKKDYLGIYLMAIDNAGNTSVKLVSQDITCAIIASEESNTTAKTITYNIIFSEDVSGFEQSDVEIENGSISSFTGSGKNYTVVVNSIEGRAVWQTLTVPKDVCTGSTRINVKKGNNQASLSIFVDRVVKPQSISLNKTILNMSENSTETLIATVLPSDALDKSVNWESSDTTVATVDQSGNVTAIKEGDAVITASCTSAPTIKATCHVSVIPVIAKIDDKYYTELQTAFDDCSNDSNIYSTVEILKSFTCNSTVELKSGKYAILDLNGYTITTSDDLTGNFLINNGDLVLKTSASGGKIESSTVTYIINNKNTLEINDVTIKHNNNKYCVYVNTSASCTLNTGKIESPNIAVNIASSSTSKFIQNNGNISGSILNYGNYELNGGTAENVRNARNFNMKSGNIGANLSQIIVDDAIGVITGGSITGIVISKGSITLGDDDGTVSTTSPQITTFGVQISDTGEFNFYDGRITGDNAIDGHVASRPSKYVIQRTKDSSTNIETAILVPGNSVDDIASWGKYSYNDDAFTQITDSCVAEVYPADARYERPSISYGQRSSRHRVLFNGYGYQRISKCNFAIGEAYCFYDKDGNLLENIHNDNGDLNIECLVGIYPHGYSAVTDYQISGFETQMPNKFFVVTADADKYIYGLTYYSGKSTTIEKSNIDLDNFGPGVRGRSVTALPEVFTHINVMAYSERYNNNDEIWQDYIISFIKKDGTAILLPGKDGTYTSDVTGDATCEDIAKNVWNLFKAVKKDFDSKSQNYGGEAF